MTDVPNIVWVVVGYTLLGWPGRPTPPMIVQARVIWANDEFVHVVGNHGYSDTLYRNTVYTTEDQARRRMFELKLKKS